MQPQDITSYHHGDARVLRITMLPEHALVRTLTCLSEFAFVLHYSKSPLY